LGEAASLDKLAGGGVILLGVAIITIKPDLFRRRLKTNHD